jgi:hypothetical protein
LKLIVPTDGIRLPIIVRAAIYRDGRDVPGKRYRMTANLRTTTVVAVVSRNPTITSAAVRANRNATTFRRKVVA